MSNWNVPINGHCEGCDEDRLDTQMYHLEYVGPPYHGHARYCKECAHLASCNWNGEIKWIRLVKPGKAMPRSSVPDHVQHSLDQARRLKRSF